jgi:hypothetical protein
MTDQILATSYTQSVLRIWAHVEVKVTGRDLNFSNDRGNTYFSEPSGMAAFIFEAEADEHPPPPVPTRVALLGSILSTEATALSICEGILEKDLIACFVTEANMREVKELQAISDELRWKIPLRQVGNMEQQIPL